MHPTSVPAALLAELPRDLAAALDLGEPTPPEEPVGALIARLGERLDAHVVAYRPSDRSPGAGPELCRLVASAALSREDVATLRAAEASWEDDVVLVAYACPLRLAALTDAGGTPETPWRRSIVAHPRTTKAPLARGFLKYRYGDSKRVERRPGSPVTKPNRRCGRRTRPIGVAAQDRSEPLRACAAVPPLSHGSDPP